MLVIVGAVVVVVVVVVLVVVVLVVVVLVGLTRLGVLLATAGGVGLLWAVMASVAGELAC